jgi:hypothetical protein
VGHFLHAVGVFFHHLTAVQWRYLGYALACHVIKLMFRAGAWRVIIDAAYPDGKLKFRTAFGAYVAGVGVNSVVPARGGDVVKLYLVKQRIPGATYATLTPTLIVETLFDFLVARSSSGRSQRRLPTPKTLFAHSTVDQELYIRPNDSGDRAWRDPPGRAPRVLLGPHRVDDFRARVRLGLRSSTIAASCVA